MNRMIKFLAFVAALVLFQSADAQVGRTYKEGPVTEATYLKIEYGHFDEYVAWLTSTWKPYMEVLKKEGLIIEYKALTARPKTPEEPNVVFLITYPNMAALDRSVERLALSEKMIGSAENQNKARVGRSSYRKNLGSELMREIILP